MKILLILLSLACLQEALAKTPYVPSTRLLRKGGYQLGVGLDSFASRKLVDKNGEVIDPGFDNYSFQRYQGDFSGQYGATDDLQFGLGARFRSNQALLIDQFNQEYSATSTGLQSISASAQYAFQMVGQLQYALETTFRYTPYTNDEKAESSPEDLILGDEGNELSAGLGVTYFSKKNNFFSFKGIYRKAGRDISDEVNLNAEAALAWTNVALIAGVESVVSVQNDPYSGDEQNRPIFNTGSNMYKSRNREWAMPYVGLNIALGNKWRLELKGGQVVYAKSYNMGASYGVQLVRRVESESIRFTDSRFKTYDIEGSIVKISDQKGYVVVDRGLTEGIQKGMRFDFFEFDYVGGNILIASGIVVEVKTETCVVKITQKYQSNKEVKEGLVGRSLLK